jgi:hypothetical protein
MLGGPDDDAHWAPGMCPPIKGEAPLWSNAATEEEEEML